MTGLATRAAVRTAFAALLTASLTGSGKPLQAVYSYTVKDFGELMPVAVVGSAGTERAAFGGHSGSSPNFLLDLWIFVLYAEVTSAGVVTAGWTEQDSEAMLDAIEASVRLLIDSSQQTDTWETIEYAGATTADLVAVGDQSYRVERIPLRFKTMQ
jgi:hypothetical protein